MTRSFSSEQAWAIRRAARVASRWVSELEGPGVVYVYTTGRTAMYRDANDLTDSDGRPDLPKDAVKIADVFRYKGAAHVVPAGDALGRAYATTD